MEKLLPIVIEVEPIEILSSVPSKFMEEFNFPVAPLVQAAEVPTVQVPRVFWVPEAPMERVP